MASFGAPWNSYLDPVWLLGSTLPFGCTSSWTGRTGLISSSHISFGPKKGRGHMKAGKRKWQGMIVGSCLFFTVILCNVPQPGACLQTAILMLPVIATVTRVPVANNLRPLQPASQEAVGCQYNGQGFSIHNPGGL